MVAVGSVTRKAKLDLACPYSVSQTVTELVLLSNSSALVANMADCSQFITDMDPGGFDRLDKRKVTLQDVPLSGQSRALNRYPDIYPTPDTRVKLDPLPMDPSSEYINANYVRAFDNASWDYIAAQGPMPETCEAFIRMVWEQNCVAIVMATGLQENGKRKCERYWPHDLGMTEQFGFIDVTLESSQQLQGYMKNILSLKRGTEVREVCHFWYNTWPDHGVPVTPKNVMHTRDVLALLEDVRAYRKQADEGKSPVVVHCSAGIGRTGAFIVTDHALNKINQGEKANLIEIVDTVRQDRMALVQHTVQYKFAQKCVVDYCRKNKVCDGPKSYHSISCQLAPTPSANSSVFVTTQDYDNPDGTFEVLTFKVHVFVFLFH